MLGIHPSAQPKRGGETSSRYKAVEKITLVTDRDTDRSCRFGLVEVANASEADKAIVPLNGTDLAGRTLTINEAKPKSEHPRGWPSFWQRGAR